MSDDITLTAEAEYAFNFTEQGKNFLRLHYSCFNSNIFVNGA